MKKMLEKLMASDGMVLLDIKTTKGVYGGSISYDDCIESDTSVSWDTSQYYDVSEHDD